MSEFIDNTLPLYDPFINAIVKASLDPALVELAKEWFPPEETPGFQEGGSGEQPIPGDGNLIGVDFLDVMTTYYERNLACTLNSMAIANVNKNCKKLQQYPLFYGMPCKLIMLLLTKELYECYNEKKFGKKGSFSRWLWGDPMPEEGLVYHSDTFDEVIECKKELMKKYGIEEKMRLYGFTPNDNRDADWRDPFGERGIDLPLLTQQWYNRYGTRPRRGERPPRHPPRPPYNPPTASDCCPPPPPEGQGCTVIVGIHKEIHDVATGDMVETGSAHQVAGEIISCDPLKIQAMEHPLQGGIDPARDIIQPQEGGNWPEPPPPPTSSHPPIPPYRTGPDGVSGRTVRQHTTGHTLPSATARGNTADVGTYSSTPIPGLPPTGGEWYPPPSGDNTKVIRTFIDWIICLCD